MEASIKISFFKSIKFKIFLMLFIFFLSFFTFTFIAIKILFRNRFQEIENQRVVTNLKQVTNIFNYSLENINVKTSDWSAWDDTYEFIVDKNKDYVESNLELGSISNLNINFMIFLNNDAQIVASIGIDLNTKKEIAIPQDLIDLLTKDSPILKHEGVDDSQTGVLKLQDGSLMFASRPIVTSNREGPTRGTLIFATFLDKKEIDVLSNLSQVPVEIVAVGEQESLLKGGKQAISILDENSILGYSLVNDFFGIPAFIIKVTSSRDITLEGSQATRYYSLIYLIGGGIFLITIMFILTKKFLKRVINLAKEISKGVIVSESKERDELAALVGIVKTAFDERELAQVRFKQVAENAGNWIWEVDKNGVYTYSNLIVEKILGYKPEDLVNKLHFYDLFAPEVKEGLKKAALEAFSKKEVIKNLSNLNVHKNGTKVLIETSCSPFLDNKGELLGYRGVDTDVTLQKKTEEDIKKRAEELERINSLMTGRELKMVEMKKEIEELKKNIK